MYQINLIDNSPNNWVYASFFADVDDKLTGSITYSGQTISSPYFLLEYKSQLTGKIKRFNPYIAYGYVGTRNAAPRFVYFLKYMKCLVLLIIALTTQWACYGQV